MNISIPDEALETAHLTPNELLIEFAAYLYDKSILSIGQAKKNCRVGFDFISKRTGKAEHCNSLQH